MRKLWILGACGVAFLGAGCEPMEAKQYNPQSNSKEARTLHNCSEAVAKIMEIRWTSEDGATEKLKEFNKRVRECMRG